MGLTYDGITYRSLEEQVRYDAEQVQLLKQADVTINENLQTINTEVSGKLTKPTNPSAESAVTMLADGTVGTRPLSEFIIFKHSINLFINVNSVPVRYSTIFYNNDNIAYTSVEQFYNKYKETSFLILLYPYSDVSGEIGAISSLKKDGEHYKVSDGFTIGAFNNVYTSLTDSLLLDISDTVTEL